MGRQALQANTIAVEYFPADKPLKLNNVTCIYCGTAFDPGVGRTKEHVIARKFVPRGSLDGCWNLIAWACPGCNVAKSEVEEHVSAITMQPDVLGRHATEDAILVQEARRKAGGSKSRRTGKLVNSSREQMDFGGALMPGVTINFNFVGPPQIDENQAWQLARSHVGAFFYMITYDRQARRGRFWTGVFAPVAIAHRGDWGNAHLIGFQQLVENWLWRVYAIGAEEYFKIAIRRTVDDPPVWAWALEWNHSHRAVGFCGDKSRIQALCNELPPLGWQGVPNDGSQVVRYRLDRPLTPEQDCLFAPGDGSSNGRQ